MASPWSIAGALAAAYELGLLQRVAPSLFTEKRDVDTRTGLFAGVAGYGLGAAGQEPELARLRKALAQEQGLRQAADLRARALAAQEQHRLQMARLTQLLGTTQALTTPPPR